MSAYIVDDSTINTILAGLYYATNFGDYGRPTPKPWNNPRIEIRTNEEAKILGDDLFALNIYGVEQRYGEGEAAKFRPLNYQYKSMLPPTTMQFLKSIDNLIYQCSEGDTSEKVLFKALVDYADQLCRHIVTNSPEYSKANWG